MAIWKVNLGHIQTGNLLSQFDKLKEQNQSLYNYGWINFPLAYTQVINTKRLPKLKIWGMQKFLN